MKTINRLKQYIDYKGISLNSFDKLLGAANGYIGKMIKNEASIGSDMIEKIVCSYPDLNADWLITGIGIMIKQPANYTDTPPEINSFSDVEHNYEQLPLPLKIDISNKNVSPTVSPTAGLEPKVIYLTPQIISVDKDGNENILYVPVRASAGYLKGMGDPQFMEKLPSFRLPGLDKKSYRAFQVDGDSMYPTLEDKEMVIGEWVEKLDYIREDRVHIIVTKKDGVLVKRLLNRIDRLGFIIAKSDSLNDRQLFPNIEIHPEDVLEVWYAVWHGGPSFKAPGDLWRRQNNLEADLTDVLRRLKEAGI